MRPANRKTTGSVAVSLCVRRSNAQKRRTKSARFSGSPRASRAPAAGWASASVQRTTSAETTTSASKFATVRLASGRIGVSAPSRAKGASRREHEKSRPSRRAAVRSVPNSKRQRHATISLALWRVWWVTGRYGRPAPKTAAEANGDEAEKSPLSPSTTVRSAPHSARRKTATPNHARRTARCLTGLGGTSARKSAAEAHNPGPEQSWSLISLAVRRVPSCQKRGHATKTRVRSTARWVVGATSLSAPSRAAAAPGPETEQSRLSRPMTASSVPTSKRLRNATHNHAHQRHRRFPPPAAACVGHSTGTPTVCATPSASLRSAAGTAVTAATCPGSMPTSSSSSSNQQSGPPGQFLPGPTSSSRGQQQGSLTRPPKIPMLPTQPLEQPPKQQEHE
mmetsp:Transcript_22650/g.55888  ORF Transcript_22650/g.55888 Transcript_22650/m.55888 type:complete len:394 (-) Transcript_22650:459-1640(-)